MIQLGQLVHQTLVVTEVTQSRMLKKLYHFDDNEEFFFVYEKQHPCVFKKVYSKSFLWTVKLFWFALKERERIIIPFLENWKLKEPDRGRDGGGGS